MSHAKDASKRKRLRKAVPTVGIAGMSLAMAGGASAATAPATATLPSQQIPLSHEIILGDEEISDVSLGTFYVFDKEDAASELGKDVQLAAGRGCGGQRLRRTAAAADAAAAAPGAAADTAAAAEAAAAEAAVAEAAAWAAAAAGAAAAAVAACRGAVAASARLERLPIALTGADRHGRVDQFNPAGGGLFAALPTWMRPKPAHSAERAASHIEKR